MNREEILKMNTAENKGRLNKRELAAVLFAVMFIVKSVV